MASEDQAAVASVIPEEAPGTSTEKSEEKSDSGLPLLEYETQIFLDLFHDDGLVISARGLGIDRILLNFLKIYSDPGNLVLVLNTTTREEEFFTEQLRKLGQSKLPRTITADDNTGHRQSIYLDGGVLFISSRILVVDMLTDRLPTDLVTGVLVYKAHKIIESCQEAFILRLFRQKNKQGFIKAFSDSPQSFTKGFCQVERVMKNLFVRKLHLWPRFHADVVKFFDKRQPEVIEIHVEMTSDMTACQAAIMDMISTSLRELTTNNNAMDLSELTLENALTKTFDKQLKLLLDPVWHQLSQRSRQLVSDIKTLRLLILHLSQYDCVTFYSLISSIRSTGSGQSAGWRLLDSADKLFVHARNRVYGRGTKKENGKASGDASAATELVLEEPPKWKALQEIIAEILEDNKTSELGAGRVLIAADDDRTCNQIRQCLRDGSQTLLNRLHRKHGNKALLQQMDMIKFQQEAGLVTAGPGGPGGSGSKDLKKKTETHEENDDASDIREMEGYYDVLQSPHTVIHPLHGVTDPYSLTRMLESVQPRYVLLYDSDLSFVRQLEVYKASRPGVPLRVYFIIYSGSTEEQRYLTSLRKEKEAFEYLIKQKATMVIPEEREGRLAHDPSLEKDFDKQDKSSRKGGMETAPVQQKVIVDMREFRSELPSLIHRKGIDIEPLTIEVGDYILTPDICVERKSISDLVGSLNNGRLYNQCVAMARYYKRPILLIEFDPNKAFSLLGRFGLTGDISSQETMSKLTLLTIHFPQLRILWCVSPYASAQLIEEIKKGKPQPDSAKALAITDQAVSEASDKFNHGPQDVLLKMPGITTKNIHLVMRRVRDLCELCSLSEEQLSDILQNKISGTILYEFLHKDQKDMPVEPTKNEKVNKRPFKRKRMK